MAKRITYVCLDMHKDTLAAAWVEVGLRGEVREHGHAANMPVAVKALAVKLAATGRGLRCCYEVEPYWVGIHRQLTGTGHECAVVAIATVSAMLSMLCDLRDPGRPLRAGERPPAKFMRNHEAPPARH
jgi:transposase